MASPWPPWRKGGGTEAHTDHLARALVALGHKVTVLTLDIAGREPTPYGVETIDSPAMKWLRGLEGRVRLGLMTSKQLHDWLLNRKAERAAARLGADVLHRQGVYAVGFRSRHPLVVTLHNGTMPSDEAVPSGWRHKLAYPLGAIDRAIRRRGMRKCLRQATEVVCVSEHVQKKIVERLGVRRASHVVANGCPYDPPRLTKAQARRKLGVPAGRTVVLFVGRLSREKRVHRLLPLLDEPGVELVLVGSGEHEAELRRHAASQPRLKVLGFQDEESKRLWLRAADVLALPSGYFEGNPLVMMEALRCGTPVYGTHAEWLPAGLRRFGRFGDDVRLALDAARLDAAAAPGLVPGWDDVARATLPVYEKAIAGVRARRGA